MVTILACFFQKVLRHLQKLKHQKSQMKLAVRITKWLKNALGQNAKFTYDELAIITDFIIEHRDYRSIEDLYEFLEHMFVHMLNKLLIWLPNAIYKSIVESGSEDFEERMKFALKALLKIEQLEEIVQWSFPSGTTITSLITDEAPVLLRRRDMPLKISKTFAGTSRSMIFSGNRINVPMAAHEVIIEIE
ncbi:hypothetical protein Sjap_008412 [Stephania japonica]|uniref:Uncharacterized protein n=1 Tax=Stephania japonica TaxID=461633 RepID=A0AAP0JPF8_9MAGN